MTGLRCSNSGSKRPASPSATRLRRLERRADAADSDTEASAPDTGFSVRFFFSDQRSETAMLPKLPMLTGYRVLDITQFVAGPTCTRILAELGAEVIKLELAPYGDRGRAAGDKPRDAKFKTSSQSTYFFQHNHSKKSLDIDINHTRDRA